MSQLKIFSEKATHGQWTVEDMHGAQLEASRHENGAYQLFSDEDCEHHAVADFSCNHSCRYDEDAKANAEFVAALVNAYRSGNLVEK